MNPMTFDDLSIGAEFKIVGPNDRFLRPDSIYRKVSDVRAVTIVGNGAIYPGDNFKVKSPW